ncbi:2-succinyl-5-enolpyruvyl-6-hydroxy-3-cyclohexene-1-carboxylic-acid synthase [Putridiphycobacter roseus]|uniref:2-succinyl-5-enolpyruvyl-6-hydroxy-3-cyclohexene-1-carboxylate synthase n=1 Tax=Putridiphycobacter roseus TaxID=2219161 RepID=A0A2W1MZY9_9FLAO|nr:2-succinyl-5-enolpyruvyl-6-hydroxy-3-cyclohexene-1-carboxylic-acid synthase [Putridiphycobacter roseus]PZE16850.1 2-succinyl-5-enolpyruvyl-6-hydroxy-3-cyclohexene-1-carboxylic-acid synthase [Putridiphycobacter roseus]
METTNIESVAYLVAILTKNDISEVIVSPGSRNAPITIALARQSDINIHLIHDERVAAFVAIGMADELKKPVAIVCTSGSAALNYAPAVAEAYYRLVPLLVITADRPAFLIDQGDGQCIRQNGIYHNFIKAEFKLPEQASTVKEMEEVIATVEEAIQSVSSIPRGPVHLNVPLYEPLYNVAEFNPGQAIKKVNVPKPLPNVKESKINELGEIWRQTKRKLIIIGQLNEGQDLKPIIDQIAEQRSVAILVENTSNLQNFQRYCHNIDRTLAMISEAEIENFEPELILQIGGAIVSKKIKVFLRKAKVKHNWRLGYRLIQEDTFLSKTATLQISPITFLKVLSNQEDTTNSNFANLWKTKDLLSIEKHQDFILNAPYSDLAVFDLLLDTLPDDSALQMGNSSVIRYCQLFNPVQGLKYYGNRGVSGIDGSTSTAVGMAIANPNQLVVLITGDISFFYDSNGLWVSDLPGNLRIFLINNNGGGIFNILPGSRGANENKLFVAPHQANAKGICEAYQVDYKKVYTLKEVEENMFDFYQIEKNARPKLMEVYTGEANNHVVLSDYFKMLSSKN